MGLPNGYQWCTLHKKGTHYDHKCRRHAPNFPPEPRTISAAAATHCPTGQDQNLASRVASMLGIQLQDTSELQPLPQNKRTSIVITPSTKRPPNFRTARDVPTNVATQGPPVTNILNSIMQLNDQQQTNLSAVLTQAGF